MNELEEAITKIVRREVANAMTRAGGFKRPSEYRIEANLTVAQVSAASGVSGATIRRWESGDYRNAREQEKNAVHVASAIGCDEGEYLASVRRQHALVRQKGQS